jgi:hypothetical protein
MNAWDEIRRILITDTSPKTMGRYRKLNLAADIFMAISPCFGDEKKEVAIFNNDGELGEALLYKRGLKELKDALG